MQNLILRGHRETKISALRMIEEMDAGPVYLKRPLSLEGAAQQIYVRCAEAIFEMIQDIVREEPVAAPQEGTPVLFERRKPQESELPISGTIEAAYDFIRMLDAEGYPRAFIDHGTFRLEFSNAQFADGKLTARVSIAKRSGES